MKITFCTVLALYSDLNQNCHLAWLIWKRSGPMSLLTRNCWVILMRRNLQDNVMIRFSSWIALIICLGKNLRSALRAIRINASTALLEIKLYSRKWILENKSNLRKCRNLRSVSMSLYSQMMRMKIQTPLAQNKYTKTCFLFLSKSYKNQISAKIARAFRTPKALWYLNKSQKRA